MILSSRPHYISCIKSLINLADDKLVGDFLEAPTKSNYSPASIFRTFSYNSTLDPTLVPAPALFVGRYTDKNL